MSDVRRTAAGFTLLEVVLAMTSLALVTAICYGAFHLGLRAVEKGEVAVVTTQRLRVASDVIIRQIKSVVPYAVRNEDEDVYPYFEGTATSMRFVTAAGMQSGGSLAVVEYRLERDPSRLVMQEGVEFSPDSLGRGKVDKGDHATVLLEGFDSLKFEYMLNDGADTEWRQAWDGHAEEMLPAAVRLVIEGLPGADATWGQEIPTMATAYGDNQGEVDDEDLQETDQGDEETPDANGEQKGGGEAPDADGGDE